jgi:uncharacterized protein YjbI with pentapeptide repeats
MSKTYYAEEEFKGIDFSKEHFEIADYELSRFINCTFAQCNLSEAGFIECTFQGCDLSMAKMNGTALRNTTFTECKLIGLPFDACNSFGFSAEFMACNLHLSSFFQQKMQKSVFRDCQLNEVDFTQADLKESVFDHCDFSKAVFSATQLQKSDFRSSYNYSIDPEENRIKGAQFSIHGLPGLLDSYGIVIE